MVLTNFAWNNNPDKGRANMQPLTVAFGEGQQYIIK
jgi:hypothetical protein